VPLIFPLIVAATSLGLAIHVHDGEYSPLAILLLTVSLLSLVAPFMLVRIRAFRELLNVAARPRFVLPTLYAVLAIQFVILFASWPGVDLPHRSHFQLAPLHSGLGVAVLLIFLGARTKMRTNGATPQVTSRAASFWFPALLVVSLLLGIWMIHSAPAPGIDVWVFQQNGAAELLRGRNPYAMTFPDIYHSSLSNFAPAYARSLVVGDRVQFGFIYPPLSLLLSTLGYAIAGDHRYAQAFALVLAVAFIGYARPGRLAKLAAALLLFTPRVFFVLGRAWTEPFVLLFLAITIFLACRRYRDPLGVSETLPELRPEILGLSLGLLFAVKQYAILALPVSFLLLPPGRRWRDWFRLLWPAFLVAATVTLPFALWNFPAFWKSTVRAQQLGPFRWDALSYLVWYGLHGHAVTQPSTTVLCSALAVLLVFGLALWRVPRDPAGFAVALSLAALGFFAFNKQAFANYYFFVIGGLCCAIAASSPLEESAASPHGERAT
jgi:hypothetical protein